MTQQEGLPIQPACKVVSISRAGYYRQGKGGKDRERETELRHQIHRAATEDRCYGYRRVTRWLLEQNIRVNHKRVLRIMREDNLLSIRKCRYVLTTDSRHKLPVYRNLARDMKLNRINQLWVSDITYIRLREGFVYLAVVLDAHSRRVVGWALADHLKASLAVEALQNAIADRTIHPGIVHHSDRGVQYCSRAYVEVLNQHGFQISMSRKGNPFDNAKAESFMKTLKVEEVYLNDYRDIDHVRRSIGHFLEDVYNRKRLHSSLDYQSPIKFEASLATPPPVEATV